MAWKFVNPETIRIDISDSKWILVKKRLNAGERRRIFSRMVKTMQAGEKIDLDPAQVGRSKLVEYLVDWNGPTQIRDKSPDEIGKVLDNLDPDDYGELNKAIEAHEDAQDAAAEQEKNATAGSSASTPI